MGLFDNLRQPVPNRVEAAELNVDTTPTAPVSSNQDGTWYLDPAAGSIPRVTAVSVPEVKRARDLIANTIANASFYEIVNGERVSARPFLQKPDPQVIRSVTVAETVADLFFDAVSVWWITSRNAATGEPLEAMHIPHDQVELMTNTMGRITEVLVGGGRANLSDVIIFQHSSDGILVTGAREIMTSVRLQQAARQAVEYPLPLIGIRNEGPKLDKQQINKFMEYYETMLRLRAHMYLGKDVSLESMGWNPEQIGLNRAREIQATTMARLTGVPAWYLSADAGDSMTYSNNTQARQDLYSFTLMAYITTIEETISAVLNSDVRMDLSSFLRTDPQARADLYKTLIESGVMTTQEAREMEDMLND